MFDVSWSELLILGLVTLIFVGPKELPRFLGTLGRYLGVVRRHANEFKSVFEQAMREAEMDQIQKEVRAVSDGVKASLDEATRSVGTAAQQARIDPAKDGEPKKADSVLPAPVSVPAPASAPVATSETEAAAEAPPAVAPVAEQPASGQSASGQATPIQPASEQPADVKTGTGPG